jgi:hypothetical protein
VDWRKDPELKKQFPQVGDYVEHLVKEVNEKAYGKQSNEHTDETEFI